VLKPLLNDLQANNPRTRITALEKALNDGDMAVEVIGALEKMGRDAAPAIPVLRQLKFSEKDAIREAAGNALKKIE
jgi:hypothetical protein